MFYVIRFKQNTKKKKKEEEEINYQHSYNNLLISNKLQTR